MIILQLQWHKNPEKNSFPQEQPLNKENERSNSHNILRRIQTRNSIVKIEIILHRISELWIQMVPKNTQRKTHMRPATNDSRNLKNRGKYNFKGAILFSLVKMAPLRFTLSLSRTCFVIMCISYITITYILNGQRHFNIT